MAIKPILFNTEMVRAILEGRKSCTRRIVKGFIPNDAKWGYTAFTPKGCISCRGTFADGYGEKFFKLPCEPGDILYVRETWERFECWNCEGDESGSCPKEPQKSVLDRVCGCYMYRATDEISGDAKWHPSIHMPKEAARIWLKVTDVRVERLQKITEDVTLHLDVMLVRMRAITKLMDLQICGIAPSKNPILTATVGMLTRGRG